jgi:hypothetical protein
MQRKIVFIGLSILIIGSSLTLLDAVSQGSLSMSGILDRLRQSYPDRSGKELSLVLNTLPWIMIVIGAFITIWGLVTPHRFSMIFKNQRV